MSASVVLERAVFEVMETAVRYHSGTASAAELAAARTRLRQLIARLRRAEAERELFAFPRRSEPAAMERGH